MRKNPSHPPSCFCIKRGSSSSVISYVSTNWHSTQNLSKNGLSYGMDHAHSVTLIFRCLKWVCPSVFPSIRKILCISEQKQRWQTLPFIRNYFVWAWKRDRENFFRKFNYILWWAYNIDDFSRVKWFLQSRTSPMAFPKMLKLNYKTGSTSDHSEISNWTTSTQRKSQNTLQSHLSNSSERLRRHRTYMIISCRKSIKSKSFLIFWGIGE